MTGRGVRKESEQFPEIAHTPGGRAKSFLAEVLEVPKQSRKLDVTFNLEVFF